MEYFLVLVLALILFVERGARLREQLLNAVRLNHRGLLKYFGAVAFLSLTLSLLPMLLLTLYMRHYGFFAYEIFGDQHQAIQILSVNVFVNFLLLAIAFFSTAIFWKEGDPIGKVIGVLISLSLITLFVLLAISTGRYDLFVSIFFFSFVIAGYLFFWARTGFDGKARLWWIPLIFAIGLVITSLVFSGYAVTLTESALTQMRVGGIDAELSDSLGFRAQNPTAILKGKLLLRTPEFYYLIPEYDKKSVLIIHTDQMSIRYKG